MKNSPSSALSLILPPPLPPQCESSLVGILVLGKTPESDQLVAIPASPLLHLPPPPPVIYYKRHRERSVVCSRRETSGPLKPGASLAGSHVDLCGNLSCFLLLLLMQMFVAAAFQSMNRCVNAAATGGLRSVSEHGGDWGAVLLGSPRTESCRCVFFSSSCQQDHVSPLITQVLIL